MLAVIVIIAVIIILLVIIIIIVVIIIITSIIAILCSGRVSKQEADIICNDSITILLYTVVVSVIVILNFPLNQNRLAFYKIAVYKFSSLPKQVILKKSDFLSSPGLV